MSAPKAEAQLSDQAIDRLIAVLDALEVDDDDVAWERAAPVDPSQDGPQEGFHEARPRNSEGIERMFESKPQVVTR